MASYGGAHCLRPGHQLGASIVAARLGPCSRAFGKLIGVERKLGQLSRDACWGGRYPLEQRGDHIEGVTGLLIGKRLRGFAGERERVVYAGSPIRSHHGVAHCLATGVRQSDQVAGEISAVHGGDVFRFQRAQVARSIPIVEMPSEALERAHRPKGRLEPLHGLERAEPPEIASRDQRQEINPDIRRRCPVSQDWIRILLKIVRREHMIFRGHEGLEETPRAPRDQPQ